MKIMFIKDSDITSIYGGAISGNSATITQDGDFLKVWASQTGRGSNGIKVTQSNTADPPAVSAFAHVFQKGTSNNADINQTATHSTAKLTQVLVGMHF